MTVEVVLANRYYLRELVQSGAYVEESLDEIAYRAVIPLMVTPDFPGIAPGQSLRVEAAGSVLLDGVVWEAESEQQGPKQLSVTAYDRTIYLARSEDEYLLPAGQTADQRLRRYAADWGIPLGSVPGTGVKLAKAVYRAQPIYSMIRADLSETARKGGKMYRPRMVGRTLHLVEVGGNKTVWSFQVGENIESISQKRTLEGTVTRVKVLGAESENKRSPVLAVVERDTAKYGTLQKIVRDDKVKTSAQAKAVAKEHLAGMQETITVTVVPAVYAIRAGDKVRVNGLERIVTYVRHRLGEPGETMMELMTAEQVRRRYYAESVL